jgi:uncharacterized protein YndB with AHSA1/START domain
LDPKCEEAAAMPTVKQEIHIDAAPAEVWRVAGDPGRIADWSPAIASSSVEGDRRSCTLADGGAQIEETILDHSDEERHYRYEVLDGPLPVSSYVSSFEVTEHGLQTQVTWAAEFEPADPAQEEELVRTFEEIYGDGLAASRRGSKTPPDTNRGRRAI